MLIDSLFFALSESVFQIVDARIHYMRVKISNDERRFGRVFLENTKMAAAFQFKQRVKSDICKICQTPHGTTNFDSISIII